MKREPLNSVIGADEKEDPSLDETDVAVLENDIIVIKRYDNMIKI